MTQPADPARLLAQVADALNQCERAGVTVRLAHGTVVTEHGYVLAVGDGRLGSRWQARSRLRPGQVTEIEEAARDDHLAG